MTYPTQYHYQSPEERYPNPIRSILDHKTVRRLGQETGSGLVSLQVPGTKRVIILDSVQGKVYYRKPTGEWYLVNPLLLIAQIDMLQRNARLPNAISLGTYLPDGKLDITQLVTMAESITEGRLEPGVSGTLENLLN